MSEIARPTAGRSFLRPPVVNRKSHSFNAADRNKIHKDVPPSQSNYGTGSRIGRPKQSAFGTKSIPVPSGGPRSNSLNAKHHFTTKLVQSTTIQNAKSTGLKSSSKINAGKHGLVKVENGKPLQQKNNNNSAGKQRLVKVKKPANGLDTQNLQVSEKLQLTATKSAPTTGPKSQSKLKMPSSKLPGKSRIASPSNTLTKTKLPNGTATPKREPKAGVGNGVKSSSMLGRLKKLGSPSTSSESTIPNNYSNGITLKQATPVKSPSQELGSKANTKKEKKLQVNKASKTSVGSRLVYKGSPNKSNIKQTSIKSTFQRAFGGSKTDSDKENQVQRPTISGPIGEPKGLPKYNEPPIEIVQDSISDNLNNNNTSISEKNKLVKIDVNNLLVSPYENGLNLLSDVSLPIDSDSDDDSSLSLSNSIENGSKFLRQPCEVPLSPRPTHLGVRNVQLPSSTEERNPEKIAHVAPFCREISIDSTHEIVTEDTDKLLQMSEEEKNQKNSMLSSIDKRPSITVNNNATDEERRQTAKGIADLRQNLEQTMSNLRSTQLRNRLSDDFERRISAQLDAELEDIGALPEVPPPLQNSNTVYRTSTTNITNGFQTIHLGTRMPKLHAGESMTGESFSTSRLSNKYSSIQRIRKPAWQNEAKVKHEKADVSISDDLCSVSSGDISEYIEGISTDGCSSNNNSPFHSTVNSKAKPNLPLSDTLHNKVMNNLHVKSPTEAIEGEGRSEKSDAKAGLFKKPKKASKLDKKKDKDKKGSTAVGSRLAMTDESESPSGLSSTPSYLPSSFDRGTLAYRSLPRPKKSMMSYSEIKSNRSSKCGSISDLIEEEKELQINISDDAQSNASSTFIRSPSLKILLRSKAKKKQLQEKSLSECNEKKDYLSHCVYDGVSDVETYSGKKHQSFSGVSNSSFLSNTQSLPRHFSTKQYRSNTTWGGQRNNANAAYSLPVTPGDKDSDNMSIFSMCSNTMDNSFTNLTVPDYDNFTDAMNSSFQSSGLQMTAASNRDPKMRLDFNRHANSTHDLLSLSSKRANKISSKPHRSSYSAAEADAKSIETATTFLYTLAKTKAVESANMVQEFESSLLHLTNRLRELTETADYKDQELKELKETIKRIKAASGRSPGAEWKEPVGNLTKKPSCTSLCSMSSQASIASSIGSNDDGFKKKKKHWFRNSFRSAFSKNKSRTSLNEDCVSPSKSDGRNLSIESNETDTVQTLKDKLRQKEAKLTDIRLEALTSQHQLQYMQDTMAKMRAEMDKLKQENESLHRIGLSAYPYATLKLTKQSKQLRETMKEVKHEMHLQIKVSIPHYEQNNVENTTITSTDVSIYIAWVDLDEKLKTLFVAYCHTIDPSGSLGLDENSLFSYVIGKFERKFNSAFPEKSPKDYFNNKVKSIEMKMCAGRHNNVASLAFELLMDKCIVENYVETLLDHQRIVISGAIGTGKSLLANRLAGFIVDQKNGSGKVVHLDAKLKEASELQDFLANLTGDFIGTSNKRAETTVVVLDNIPNPALLQTLFQPLLSASKKLSPHLYFICILPYCDESTLHYNQFQWIVFSSATQPVESLLTRKLRRSYIENQISNNDVSDDLLSVVILWLPKCCQHVNNCLEAFGDFDVTIGPRMFSDCPMNAATSRVWFADIWNYTIVPYVISVVRSYMNKTNSIASEISTKWKDPTLWVKETMPWNDVDLHYIKIDDVVTSPTTDSELSVTSQTSASATSSSSDPLLNMLMRLQEATNYDTDSSQSGQPLDYNTR